MTSSFLIANRLNVVRNGRMVVDPHPLKRFISWLCESGMTAPDVNSASLASARAIASSSARRSRSQVSIVDTFTKGRSQRRSLPGRETKGFKGKLVNAHGNGLSCE